MLEFVHNRNRIKATSPANRNMAWSTLSSSCLNHEALLDSFAARATNAQQVGRAEGDACRPKAEDCDVPRCGQVTRKWRAIDFFRQGKMAEARSLGIKQNWFSVSRWQALRGEFEVLPHGERDRYEDLANASTEIAKGNRVTTKAATTALLPLPASSITSETSLVAAERSGQLLRLQDRAMSYPSAISDTNLSGHTAENDDDFPMSAATLSDFRKAEHTTITSLNNACKSQYGKPIFERKAVPEKVVRR